MAHCLVRAATPDDAPQAVALLRDSITQLCVPDHRNDPVALERWLRNKTVEHFCRWLADPDNHLLLAETDGAVNGVALLHRSGQLYLCYIKPGSQRSGLGRALIAALEAQARRWGVEQLELQSTSVARAFYEAQGFLLSGAPEPGLSAHAYAYPYTKRLVPLTQ